MSARRPPAARDLPRRRGEAPLGVGDSLTRLDLGGRAVRALRESPTHFLMISSAADAPGTWAQLHEAGDTLGAGHAGSRALERYLVGERLQNDQQGTRRPLV